MRLLFIWALSFYSLFSPAQSLTENPFKLLRLTNGEIRKNDTINERIIDLVEVSVLDSVISKKKPHHRLFLVGWAIHAFGGYNWRALDYKKRKFVGTVERSSRSNEAEYTEHDVNLDLYFNTPKYLQMAFLGYDRQGQIKRQDFRRGKHLKDYSVPPYKRDTTNIDKWLYRIHAELTPPAAYRQQLNLLFYPVYHNQSLATHPNVQDPKPTVGVYGVYCSDCNHSCQPELHPYEWIWWMNTIDTLSTAKTWTASLFHEGSNRMPEWSSSPKMGTIAIPFSTPIGKNVEVNFQPMTMGELIENGAYPLVPQGTRSQSLNFGSQTTELQTKAGKSLLTFNNSNPLPTNAVQYWIETLEDNDANFINGYIHFSVAARDLFTFKMEVK